MERGSATMSSGSSSTEFGLTELLNCPVCLDLPAPGTIQQCRNGHTVCGEHLRRLTDCPVCRISYSQGSSRNLLAEKLVETERSKRQRQLEQERRLEIEQQQQRERDRGGPANGQLASHPLSSNGLALASATVTVSCTHSLRIQAPTFDCKYIEAGCPYTSHCRNSTQQHELNCHFRPVVCCFSTDGCNNSLIPFFDYITHLKGLHRVKAFEGSHHVHHYVVRTDNKKLLRGGSSSLFILDVANQLFLVRGMEVEGRVCIWVSFHGHPEDGRSHRAEIEFNFQEDEVVPRQNVNPGPSRAMHDSRPAGVDYSHPFAHSGIVSATTRQTWDDVVGPGNFFSMAKGDVQDFLKQGAIVGRHPAEQTWAINVSITRPAPPPPNSGN